MAFWKPGAERPASALDRPVQDEVALDPSLYVTDTKRTQLPVYRYRTSFLYMVERYSVVVVVGQTGSGKTTQLPQYLLEAGWAAEAQQIVCTQPRRIAATSVAARVAQETGTRLGDDIGYAIRFDECTHPTRTRIRYTTPGMLFRECMQDPLLQRYSVILIDEAHERGAYTDLLMALLKKIRRKRPELRIVLASATVDAEALATYFDPAFGTPHANASILSMEAPSYPVSLAYTREPVPNYVDAAVHTVWSLHLSEPKGDILVFFPGRDDIETAMQALADREIEAPAGALPMHLVPLYAELDADAQRAVFLPAPRGTRKVVLSTNVAETSLTIDGIRLVVDTGYSKTRYMDTLVTIPTSQAAAQQRAGRAGRTAPGKCVRLYPESQWAHLPRADTPELVRIDLAMYLLQLKALGIDNLARFDFVPPAPPAAHMCRALAYLASLEAIDVQGHLTSLGERLAEAPLPPMMARSLLYAAQHGCADEMLSIAAMMSVASPFRTSSSHGDLHADIARRAFIAEEGDALTLLNVYQAFVGVGQSSAAWASKHALHYATLKRAQAIRTQLAKYVTLHWSLPLASAYDARLLQQCLAAGYFKNAARYQPDGTYRSVEGVTLHVHPTSVLFARKPTSDYVVYADVLHTSQAHMRDVTAVEEAWLRSLAPHYYETRLRPSIQ